MLRLILSALLLGSTAVFAQPVIQSEDLVSGPDSYNVVDAAGASAEVYELAGEGQVWDFSALTPLNPAAVNYVSIDDAPFGYQFFFNSPFVPNYEATHAIEGEGIDLVAVTIDEFFFFYKNTPTQYNIVGYGGTVNGVPLPAQTNPIDVVYALPIEFGNTHASYSEWGIEIPTVGTYRQRQNRSYEAEGYGTVITPEGSYEALKLRVELQIEDSLYVELLGQGLTFNRESVVHTWLVPGEGIPVLEITETFGQALARYKAAPTIGIPETPVRDGIRVWPTVCTDGFWIEGAEEFAKIDLYDLRGNQVRNGIVSGYQDANGLAQGAYIVVIQTGDQIETRRIIVQP